MRGQWTNAAVAAGLLAMLTACASARAGEAGEIGSLVDMGSGEASYFGDEMAGNRTANGERCDPETLTAAHPTAPLGSRLRVTNAATGASVVVRVNDRGPFTRGRVIDLSRAAARKIGMLAQGHARVQLALVRDDD